MDLIGITMGVVTIPMAILTLAGIAGGLGLLLGEAWQPLGVGLAAIVVGIGIAVLIERVVAMIDALAIAVARRYGRGAGLSVGVVGAMLPMAVILAWEWQCLTLLPALPGETLRLSLWTYAIATVPWIAFAARAGGNRRTLSGIRAYAAHIAFWFMVICRVWIGAPDIVSMVVMAIPAILPITVGSLLAVADRDALRNVQI